LIAARAPKPAGTDGSGSRQPLCAIPQRLAQQRPPPPDRTASQTTAHASSVADRARTVSELAEPRRSAAASAAAAGMAANGVAAGAKRARGADDGGPSGAPRTLSGAVRPTQIACKYPLTWVPPQPPPLPPPPRAQPARSATAQPAEPPPAAAAAAAARTAPGPQCPICTQLLYRPVIAYKCDPAHVHTYCLKCVLTSVALRGPDHTCPNCRAARSEQMLMPHEWWAQIQRDHPDEVRALAQEHEAFFATHDAAAKLAKSREGLRARMEGLQDELADKDAYLRRLDDELKRGQGELLLCACKCVCIQQTFTSPAHMVLGLHRTRRFARGRCAFSI
jgi:hypothetical protein